MVELPDTQWEWKITALHNKCCFNFSNQPQNHCLGMYLNWMSTQRKPSLWIEWSGRQMGGAYTECNASLFRTSLVQCADSGTIINPRRSKSISSPPFPVSTSQRIKSFKNKANKTWIVVPSSNLTIINSVSIIRFRKLSGICCDISSTRADYVSKCETCRWRRLFDSERTLHHGLILMLWTLILIPSVIAEYPQCQYFHLPCLLEDSGYQAERSQLYVVIRWSICAGSNAISKRAYYSHMSRQLR